MLETKLIPAGINVTDLSTDRTEAVKEMVVRVNSAKSDFNLALAELLHIVKEERLYERWSDTEEFKSFEHWGSEVLNRGRALLYSMVSVYKNFVLSLDVDPERLRGIGWSKLAAVVAHVNKDNLEDLLTFLENHTLKETQKMVRSLKPKEEQKEVGKTYRFKTEADQAEVIDSALTIISELANTEIPGKQLEYLAADFLCSSGLDCRETHLERCVDALERAFNVKITVSPREVVDGELVGGTA